MKEISSTPDNKEVNEKTKSIGKVSLTLRKILPIISPRHKTKLIQTTGAPSYEEALKVRE